MMKLSEQLRYRAATLSKWPKTDDASVLLQKAADELEKMEKQIKRMKEAGDSDEKAFSEGFQMAASLSPYCDEVLQHLDEAKARRREG